MKHAKIKMSLLVVASLLSATLFAETQGYHVRDAQLPAYLITSPNATSGLMSSGSKYASNLSTEQNVPISHCTANHVGPRRLPGTGTGEPFLDPLGDVMWPMMALACAYALARAFLKYLLYRKKQ